MGIPKKKFIFRIFPFRLVCLFFVLFFILPGRQSASARNLIDLNADTQLEYADYCYQNKDYEAAAAEYKRFIYFFPNDDRVDMAGFKIGMCNFHDKFYVRALNQFTRILDEKGATDTGISSAFMISRCYQRLRNYSAAIDNLNYLKQITSDPDLADKIDYHLGWLYLESGDFYRAQTVFSRISMANQSTYHITHLTAELNTHAQIPQKNPVTAGIFSVIPGGGYLYCGRYRDALTAFLVNSALIYGAYESFDEELYAIGGIISVVELGFYTGNIYGGISSAHKYNQRKKTDFVERLKEKFTADFSMTVHSKSILLGMTCRF